VREGIVKHSHDYRATEHPDLETISSTSFPRSKPAHRSGDEIAYLTADLDDGLDSGILTLEQVRDEVDLFRRFHDGVVRDYPPQRQSWPDMRPQARPERPGHDLMKRSGGKWPRSAQTR